MITVIVLAFLTVGKMQSTINQFNHGKGRAVPAIMVLGVVLIDHTALGYASCCMALSTTPLVPFFAHTALPSVLQLIRTAHIYMHKYTSTCV